MYNFDAGWFIKEPLIIGLVSTPRLSNKFINFFGTNSLSIDCTFSENESLSISIKRIQKEVLESIYDIPLEDRISYYQEFDDWFFSGSKGP